MKKYIFLFFVFSFLFNWDFNFFAQKNNVELQKTKKEIKSLKSEFQLLQKKINSDINEVKINSEKNKVFYDSVVKKTELTFNKKISQESERINKNNIKLQQKVEELNSSKQLFLFIFILASLFTLISLIFALIQRKRLKSVNAEVINLVNENKTQQNQIMQLKTNSSENLAAALEKIATASNKNITETAPDHSMVIEFAKHITTIENNMSRMDPNDRGLARIKRAIENMHNSLKSMDYEITTFIGREIREGEIIEVDISEPDDSIEMGKKIIFNVVKAEILFQGKQIQRAKVDVKYNPNN